MVQGLVEPGQHHLAAGLETGIQVHRADDGLDGVGEDRIAAVAAALHFPRPQLEPVAQLQAARQFGQRGLAHQAGTGPGQRPLVGLGPTLVQRLGDDQVDQGVTEEFQAFVVRRSGAAVPEGLLQQFRFAETVTERVGHWLGRPLRSTVLSNLPTTSRLPNIGTRTS